MRQTLRMCSCRCMAWRATPLHGKGRMAIETAELEKAFAQAGNAPRPDAEIRARYTKYDYRIPMRDGMKLFTSVYVPKDASASQQYPIMMTRTPYSVGP